MKWLIVLALVVGTIDVAAAEQWWRFGRAPKPPQAVGNDALPLLSNFSSNFTYLGAFKVATSPTDFPEYYGIAYASSTTMWFHDDAYLTKIDIPALIVDPDISDLNQATVTSGYSWQDFWTPAYAEMGQSTSLGFMLTGVLQYGSSLLMQAHKKYDGSNAQVKSTWKVSTATALASEFPTDSDSIWDCDTLPSNCQGFVSQYLAPIPAHWQSDLGGDTIAGSANCSSIIGRQSMGLSAFVLNGASIGGGTLVAATALGYYPEGHRTWGEYEEPGVVNTYAWGPNSCAGNLTIIPNTRTALAIGATSQNYDNYCYGPVTTDPDLVGTPGPMGYVYCWEGGAAGNEGPHSYPYEYHYWMVDVSDWKAVKNGTKQYCAPLPYAHGAISLPYTPSQFRQRAAYYDTGTKKLYIVQEKVWSTDNKHAVIHVYVCTGCP